MFSYEFINRIFDSVLTNASEIFVDLLVKRGVRELSQNFFFVVAKTTAPPLSAALTTMFLPFFKGFSVPTTLQ